MRSEPSRRGRGRPPHPDILTPREWQVLALLRQGLTNEQIAQRLDISFATAKYHVAEIISKLRVATREEAAAWQPEPVPVRWWQRATAWVPRRAWPLAGAAVGLAALVALGFLAWSMRDRDEEQQAVAAPSTTRGAGPADEPSASVALPVGPPASAHQLTYAGSDAALYLINADGTGRVKFTDKTECITASFPPLQWSPKGDRLACMASTPDRTQQSLAILDGSGQVLGSMPASGVMEIAWSPTGEALLLQSADTITVVDSHGTLITRLGPTVSSAMTGIQRYSLWSPDGLRIAYWAADSAELRIFSLESLSEQTVAGDYRPLAWLSRQESILVTSNHRSPANEGGYRSWEVSRLDLWNGNLTRVPFLDAGPPLDRADGLPIRGNQQYWLGPNDLIVVLTTRSDGLSGLGMYDVVTGSFTPIPDSLISFGSDHIPAGAVSYFGKGAQLYWLDFQRGTTIYRANIDGTALQRVADADSFGAAMSPDATTIAYTEFSGPDPGHPSSSDSLKLYIAGIDGASAVEIDSRPVQGGFTAPFSAVWRPIPPISSPLRIPAAAQGENPFPSP